MKKLICVIPITILICILLSNVKVSAITANAVGYHINYLADVNTYVGYIIVYNFQGWANTTDTNKFLRGTVLGYNPQSDTLSGCINLCENVVAGIAPSTYDVNSIVSCTGAYYVKNIPYRTGSFITPTPSPTPTPTPAPSWSKIMWDTLKEELGNPAFWFGEWFIDIIDFVFGNDEEPSQGPSRISDSTHIQQVTPAPTPTPIPYSTITVPKTDIITGQTVYETNYYYVNPSGTPIVATSPPTNPPAQNDTGGGSGDNYNPVDPYSIPDVSWFTAAEIGDTSYDGIDSIMQGFDSIDTIGNDYTDGMSAVEDATGTLPTSWLLLIGIAAAIPLIAGIISRFLS